MTSRARSLAGAQAPEVAAAFAIPGRLLNVERFERGHIHDTFVSSWSGASGTEKYLHQRINDGVFRDVPGLMHNVAAVTAHLGVRRSAPRALELIATADGRDWLDAPSGAWRTYRFVENSISHDRCTSPELAFEAGAAFGRFQADLADLDAARLRVPLPGFFSASGRAAELEAAAARDVLGRRAGAAAELAAAAAMRPWITDLEARLAGVPQRIVHGDTKLNNVLFDADTGVALCIVDLDTCMPGWSLYDFGDLVRFTAATSAEDERDLDLVGTDPDLYRALEAGYLEGTGAMLTPDEIALMPHSAAVVTLMIGMRFLADHLSGDVYFRAARDGHNLDRARVQLAMAQRLGERLR